VGQIWTTSSKKTGTLERNSSNEPRRCSARYVVHSRAQILKSSRISCSSLVRAW
jgi:hypothetical protein